MYKHKHSIIDKRNYEGQRYKESKLVAKFYFGKEIAPKDRKEIYGRIRDAHGERRTDEGFVSIKKLAGLGIKLTCQTRMDEPLVSEKYLDYLNTYILTGKCEDKIFRED
jgi:hypothetical protein